MSQETQEWLSNNVLVGFTEKRGKAWHYREGDNNHYEGQIPVEDVRTRLFGWEAQSKPLFIDVAGSKIEIADRQAIVRSDNNEVFGIFKSGYQIHQYDEWLLTTVANILDDDLSVSSAGLLKGGAVAWVEVSVPDTIETPEGVTFRPNLLATTSLDGSLATTFKRTITNTVCDNTLAAALDEKGQQHKVRHSKYSNARLDDIRSALEIVHTIADDFAAQVAELTRIDVDQRAWEAIVAELAPQDKDMSGSAYTRAENKRDALYTLWNNDERVSPWAGTAYGVLQAVNTYEHHLLPVRGASRAERNMLKAVNGTFEALDTETVALVTKVLADA